MEVFFQFINLWSFVQFINLWSFVQFINLWSFVQFINLWSFVQFINVWSFVQFINLWSFFQFMNLPRFAHLYNLLIEIMRLCLIFTFMKFISNLLSELWHDLSFSYVFIWFLLLMVNICENRQPFSVGCGKRRLKNVFGNF